MSAEKIKTEEEKPHYHGHRQRLKERLLESKKGTLPDYELLEIILFSASPRKDMKPLAKELINKFGSYANVIAAPIEDLKKINGVNISVIAMLKAIQESAERLIKEEVCSKPILQSWKALIDYSRATMGHIKKEQFRILYLDKKNKVILDELQEAGTVDQTPVYPREIVKQALNVEASSVIMVHNHPSGDTKPSRADIDVTKKVIAALKAINVTLHDHVIISRSSHYSFKSNGII
ncbi:DNA repair protein RadC [Rickettsiales bacterium]|nr:DNA repair protein RadC [Rickettsiales bacterium]